MFSDLKGNISAYPNRDYSPACLASDEKRHAAIVRVRKRLRCSALDSPCRCPAQVPPASAGGQTACVCTGAACGGNLAHAALSSPCRLRLDALASFLP